MFSTHGLVIIWVFYYDLHGFVCWFWSVLQSSGVNIFIVFYRSLAQKWHPDHYEGKEKEKAEKMFIDIAAAKEVLTDEGKLTH